MLTTIMTVAICVTCICAIGAAWDAARRYIDMRRFNQAALDNLTRIENEHQAIKTKVQALNDKLTVQTVSNVSRMNSRGTR